MTPPTPDLINASFEALGAFAALGNIRRLLIDKQVHGVSTMSTTFFLLWGFWNMYYYPNLGQWASFYGGLALVLTNVWRVALMVYYIRTPGGRYAPR